MTRDQLFLEAISGKGGTRHICVSATDLTSYPCKGFMGFDLVASEILGTLEGETPINITSHFTTTPATAFPNGVPFYSYKGYRITKITFSAGTYVAIY